MSGPAVVELVRSGFVESVHTGSVLVLDRHGAPLLSLGDVQDPVLPRSANKPLQAVGLLEAGWEPGDERQVALACASRSGEARHVAVVAAMLAGAGLDEGDLGCPAQMPLGEAAKHELLRAGGGPSRLHMNCSGKHAAMLACCVDNGWPTAGYLEPQHPVQQALTATIARLAGEPVPHVAVDGCGAPQHALPLTGLASAFCAVATGTGASAVVAAAMRAHPQLLGGQGRDVSALAEGIDGLLVKDGAEGVYAAALPDGRSFAVKVHDGADRAAPVLLCAALRVAGVTAPVLETLARVDVLGGGARVGWLAVSHPEALTQALGGR